jgi:hypothetical protein
MVWVADKVEVGCSFLAAAGMSGEGLTDTDVPQAERAKVPINMSKRIVFTRVSGSGLIYSSKRNTLTGFSQIE